MWTLVLGIPLGIVFGVALLPALSTKIVSIILLLAAVFALLYGWSRSVQQGARHGRNYRLWNTLALLVCMAVGGALGSTAVQRCQSLPLVAGQSYFITGKVTGVPVWGKFSRRYRINASCIGTKAGECDQLAIHTPFWPVVVEVTASGGQPDLLPGQLVQLRVRAKQSRHQNSPAAFDVQRWSLTTHTVARMALVKGEPVQVLTESLFSIDRFRSDLNRYLMARKEPSGLAGIAAYPVILALVSGDRSLMSDRHWDIFNRTGTTHLVAISGLHIGLVATFIILVTSPLFRRWRWFTHRFPASHGAVFVAWWVALLYTAMAGFALPTQRALIMLTVFVILKLLGRAGQLWFGLAAAFCVVLLWDPLACLSMGFWLSFTAVYLILWLVGGEITRSSVTTQWLRVQLGLFVGLAPVLLWTVHSVSLVSAFTNAVAIPVIGFVVVPLSLLWALLWSVLGEGAGFLLETSAYLLDGLLWLLQESASWRYSVWTVGEHSIGSMVLAMVGVLWLASAGVPGRLWGVVLMLPLLMPQTQGEGVYVMGEGSGRLVLQQEEQVVSISRSHWPQLVAGWQSDLMRHWGVDVPVGVIPVENSKALWLAGQGVVSHFPLSTNVLGARQLDRLHYQSQCEGVFHRGSVRITPLTLADSKPEPCALVLEWPGSRWLYWPVSGTRQQRALLKQWSAERFDVIVLDLGKGKRVDVGVFGLLKAQRNQVISLQSVPEETAKLMEQQGISLHTVVEDGYYFQPLLQAAVSVPVSDPDR